MATGQKHVFKASGTTTATGNSGWKRVGKDCTALVLRYRAGQATAGSSPTLDFSVTTNKTGSDTGARTVSQGTALTQTTGVSGATDQQRRLTDIDEYVKVTWTIGGTGGPSFPTVRVDGIIERKFAV